MPAIDLLLSSQHLADLASSVQKSELFTILIQVAAYVTPYFLIPATFKFGMGVFGNLAGMINDRGRGFFDKQRKFREGSRAAMRQRAREGNRYQGRGFVRDRVNKGIHAGMTAPGAVLGSGNTFKPQNWASTTRAQMQNAHWLEAERNLKENQAYQSWAYDDGLNKAAARSRDASELRTYLSNMVDEDGNRMYQGQALDDAVNRVETVRRSMSAPAFQAMTTRQAGAGGTAYKSDPKKGTKTAAGEFWLDVARASVNDDAMASSLVANGRSEGMKAGRIDYAGVGFGTTLSVVNSFRQKLRNGEEVTQDDIEAATRKIHKDVYGGQGGASLVHSSMKPDAIKEMLPEMVGDIEIARATGSDREFTQSLASLAAVYDGMQGSSPEKARLVADGVLNQEIDVATLSDGMKAKLANVIQPTRVEETQVHELQPDGSGGTSGTTRTERKTVPAGPARTTITYQQAVDALRGDGEFKQMRREYASEVDRQLGQQPPEPGTGPNVLPGS